LATFVESLSDAEWKTRIPGDGRSVGVIVHHVASVYPIEIQLAQMLASGKAIEGVTWDHVAQMNSDHAAAHAEIGKAEALETLRTNSLAAAATVRVLTDDELDRAAPVSLNAGAPLTTQFMIEDHAVRHSFAHLARIRSAIGR